MDLAQKDFVTAVTEFFCVLGRENQKEVKRGKKVKETKKQRKSNGLPKDFLFLLINLLISVFG